MCSAQFPPQTAIGYFVGIVVVWSGEPPDDVNLSNRAGDQYLEIWPGRVGQLERHLNTLLPTKN